MQTDAINFTRLPVIIIVRRCFFLRFSGIVTRDEFKDDKSFLTISINRRRRRAVVVPVCCAQCRAKIFEYLSR